MDILEFKAEAKGEFPDGHYTAHGYNLNFFQD